MNFLQRSAMYRRYGVGFCLAVYQNKIRSSVFTFLQLEEIDFAENSLQYIPSDVKFLKRLRELDLSKNDFEELPVELCFVTTLTKLLFNDNHITTLPFQIQNVSHVYQGSHIWHR